MDLVASLNASRNLAQAFFAMAEAEPEREVYSQPQLPVGHYAQLSEQAARTQGEFLRPSVRSFPYVQVARRVRKIMRFLRSLGVKKGDRVAILSNTRPEWMEADIAVLAVGAVSVSIYPSLPASDVGYILFDSGARIVFAENQEQLAKLHELVREPCEIPATEEREALHSRIAISAIITFERTDGDTGQSLPLFRRDSSSPAAECCDAPSVVEIGEIYGARDEDVEQRTFGLPDANLTRDDLATLVYTSGTTGPPKGVMQTHGNHLANVRQGAESGLFDERSRIFMFLPLAHSFAKLMGYVGFLTPASLEFVSVSNRRSSKPNLEAVARDMRKSTATFVPVVPRLLEKMHEGIVARTKQADFEARLLSWTLSVAEQRYEFLERGMPVPPRLRALFALSAPLRWKIRESLFGLRFQYAISGGAKLQIATNKFFDALGIEVLEGYGLTETCVATNVNRLGRKKIGTVGPVLSADIELQIAADGEILFRGPNIARGYYGRPAATAQAWDRDGWFHTGDLGDVDTDGFLKIVGRKKELIVTAGGKKIAPEPIEQRLKESQLISQAMLYGEGRPYCVVLVTVQRDAVAAWLKEIGRTEPEIVADDPQLNARLWGEVERVNAALASFESIKRLLIIPDEFTTDNGLLTPTMKVRRREVAARYQDQIEALYASSRE